ncbi:hypothetical protein [Microcoleus sp. Pol12B5]
MASLLDTNFAVTLLQYSKKCQMGSIKAIALPTPPSPKVGEA